MFTGQDLLLGAEGSLGISTRICFICAAVNIGDTRVISHRSIILCPYQGAE